MLPYPRPIGNDGQLPLMATNADGIHATDNAVGPRLINCYFGGLGAASFTLPFLRIAHPELLPCCIRMLACKSLNCYHDDMVKVSHCKNSRCTRH